MNFNERYANSMGPDLLSTVTWFTEGLRQQNLDGLVRAGDSFDDFAR